MNIKIKITQENLDSEYHADIYVCNKKKKHAVSDNVGQLMNQVKTHVCNIRNEIKARNETDTNMKQ